MRSVGLDDAEVSSPDVDALYHKVGDGDPMGAILLPPADPMDGVRDDAPADQ